MGKKRYRQYFTLADLIKINRLEDSIKSFGCDLKKLSEKFKLQMDGQQ
jgi:hypothetical protein